MAEKICYICKQPIQGRRGDTYYDIGHDKKTGKLLYRHRDCYPIAGYESKKQKKRHKLLTPVDTEKLKGRINKNYKNRKDLILQNKDLSRAEIVYMLTKKYNMSLKRATHYTYFILKYGK